ncbi:MAG: peptidylprolyl isomerase [Hominilimicola sp.]
MKFTKISSLLIASALLISGCASNGGSVAMQIGDKKITEGAVRFVAEYGMNTTNVEDAAELIEQNYLVNEIASELGVTLSDEEQKNIRSAVASFKSQMGGKKAGDKILKECGIDDSVLEAVLSTSTYAQKISDKLTIEEATDDEKKQYFEDEYLRAKHILISTKDQTTNEEYDDEKKAEAEKKANEILERAKNGEDFDALITEFNEDPGMSSNPDGYFFTDGEMVTEFEDAVKSVQPGEITICKSDYGYHIIKRLPIDKSDADFEKFFEDNKYAVESGISQKKQKEAISNKAEELGIQVTVNQDVIDSIVIEPKDTEETADK